MNGSDSMESEFELIPLRCISLTCGNGFNSGMIFGALSLSIRTLVPTVALFGILSSVHAQEEPKDTPLYLGSGVRVEYHPNNFPEYKLHAPETSEVCAPEDMGNSCGRVWWNSSRNPVPGQKYVTQVPRMVRLRGQGREAWWSPFVHCMIKDVEQKLRSTSPPGVQCISMLKKPEERMEWALGGTVTGIDYAIPGTYTGIIQLTVTRSGVRWELDIPVAYIVHKSQQVCAIRVVDPDNLDFEFDKVVEGQTRTWNVGFGLQVLGSGNIIFDALGPESPSPTFELRAAIRQSFFFPPSDPPWRDYSVSFTAHGFENLSPGWYDHRWRLSVMCGESG